MRKYYYRQVLIFIAVLTSVLGCGYYGTQLNQQKNNVTVDTEVAAEDIVLLGGMPVGIYMETDGVMVIGTDKIKGIDGQVYEPSAHVVRAGDYITKLNDTEIHNKMELVDQLKTMTTEEVTLMLRRNEAEIEVKVKPVQSGSDEYKLGIWVRDNVQGLGTITFVDQNSCFGALGHGIHDVDTGELLEIDQGTLYQTSIRSITKGIAGVPGNMEGIIVYNTYNELGEITQNTEKGIYGTVDELEHLIDDQIPIEVGKKEEIKKGKATTRCCVEGKVQEYEIEILDIDYSGREVNKSLVVEVTDPQLLSITGGIVQGMSGSPIIQNGKLVGAITHVFVQDSAKGYGIFIDDMMSNLR